MQQFEVNPIARHVEPNEFASAITAHEKYIIKLEEYIKTVKIRLDCLRKAHAEGLFRNPMEYDNYISSKTLVDKIDSIRLEQQKKTEQQTMQYKNTVSELVTSINDRWSYFWRCVEYMDNGINNITYWDESSYSHKKLHKTNTFTYDCVTELYLAKDIETLRNILKRIEDTIISAHRQYNEYLVANYNTVCKKYYHYSCNCDIDHCTAQPNDHRTSGCERKIVWADDGIEDLDNGFTLDSKEPIGHIEFF